MSLVDHVRGRFDERSVIGNHNIPVFNFGTRNGSRCVQNLANLLSQDAEIERLLYDRRPQIVRRCFRLYKSALNSFGAVTGHQYQWDRRLKLMYVFIGADAADLGHYYIKQQSSYL